jgi:16S rRNA (uracil1498-N3)-methyltransferase
VNQLFFSTRVEGNLIFLEEEESRHLLTVLRRKVGDPLSVTDGRGHFFETNLIEIGKKNAVASIVSQAMQPARPRRLHLAVAPTKQMDRFEWMLEKCVEIGVETVTPIRCQRSERDTLRLDRLEKIAVSAMKQSLRAHLPTIEPLTPLRQLLAAKPTITQGLVAWCADEPPPHLGAVLDSERDALILIGPEGDFTLDEVQLARQAGFVEVGLGAARLRTETAGLLAAATFALRSA